MAEVESVNTNTDTSAVTEPVEVAPGDSFTSFDELSNISEYRSKYGDTAGKEEPKAAPKKDAKGEKKDAEKASEPVDEGTLDKKASKPSDADRAKTEADLKKEPPPKMVKVKSGDEESELPVNVTIPVKVNGKETSVTLEELRNNYAGKTVWEKEFSKLNVEKQSFTKERESVVGKLSEVFKASQQDPIMGLMKMAEITGMDPLKFRADFLGAMRPALEKYMELDENERRALDLETEKSYWQSQAQERIQREQQDREYSQFETQTLQTLQKEGISQTEFEQAFKELDRLARAGEYQPSSGTLGVAEVVSAVKAYKVQNTVTETLAEMKIDADDETVGRFLRQFMPVAMSQKLSKASIARITAETLGDLKAKTLSKKLQRSKPEKIENAKATKATVNPYSEPLSFDDL